MQMRSLAAARSFFRLAESKPAFPPVPTNFEHFALDFLGKPARLEIRIGVPLDKVAADYGMGVLLNAGDQLAPESRTGQRAHFRGEGYFALVRPVRPLTALTMIDELGQGSWNVADARMLLAFAARYRPARIKRNITALGTGLHAGINVGYLRVFPNMRDGWTMRVCPVLPQVQPSEESFLAWHRP